MMMMASCECRVDERGDVKVADFGLSRELLLRDYYRSDGSGTTPVPVRWLAPESLEASVFTTMSDVVRINPPSLPPSLGVDPPPPGNLHLISTIQLFSHSFQ